MKTSFISSSAISDANRLSLAKLQAKLVEAQKEVATGRLADVGASLGYRAGQSVSLRQDHARLAGIIDANATVSIRLEGTQAALQQLVGNAQDFVSQLLAARNAVTGPHVAQQQAQTGLQAFLDTINTANNGQYLFSGINADEEPVADYYAPGAGNRQAVANAFQAAFGMAQSDPGVAAISAADMHSFLDGAFAGLFDGTAWRSDWSSAADQDMLSRISTSEVIETSSNANEQAIRKLASAYTMVADLGAEGLGQQTFQTVVDKAVTLASEAIASLSLIGSDLGTAQERVKNANDRMSMEIDIMTKHIGGLESVDPYEASTRLSQLMTQVETAYAMTARVQKLSLLNYL
ncbi:MAG TPA: flagellar hook-associated family protein [Hyphomicrobiaceae bacterium]|jgi:flagellar hook-associated protein 3 FlgL|nr:flagellar hook-associated family protein [Hyphomicrobiaceae bacterium]